MARARRKISRCGRKRHRRALGARSVVLVGMMGVGRRRSAGVLRCGSASHSSTPTRNRKAAQMNIPDIFATRGGRARAGEARHSSPARRGAGRRLAAALHECRYLYRYRCERTGLAQGRIRRVDAAHSPPPPPSAAQDGGPRGDATPADGAALSSLRLADITVQSREVPHDKIVDEIMSALAQRTGAASNASADGGRALRLPATLKRSGLVKVSSASALTFSSAADCWLRSGTNCDAAARGQGRDRQRRNRGAPLSCGSRGFARFGRSRRRR